MLKEKGAKKVFFITTFSLFTEGIELFEKAHKAQIFDKLYTTNLFYIPDEYKQDWLKVIDCSKRVAEIIDAIHNGKSLTNIVHNKEEVFKLLEKKK